MFRVDLSNVAQKRTIRPLYAATQATPYSGYLDPAWDRSVDILPGMVVTKLADEVFTLATTTTAKGFGLAALFVAPVLGIDEVRNVGTNAFPVWTGGYDAVFEVLAPAFDPNANWTQPTDGTKVYLTHTSTASAAGPGLLTPLGSTGASTNKIAELISVVGTSKILVRLGVNN